MTVRFEPEDRVVTITIDRPEVANAIDADTAAALAAAIGQQSQRLGDGAGWTVGEWPRRYFATASQLRRHGLADGTSRHEIVAEHFFQPSASNHVFG